MSLLAVRQALETALVAMTPALQTKVENRRFTPTSGTAYQRLTMLPQRPGNEELGPNYTQAGDMQVDLFYPADDTGPAAAQARAELIRTTFYRGRTLVSGAVAVTVLNTPEIAAAYEDDDRYVIPVFVPFFASITA